MSIDNWVATRKIWNQHSYHVTNINEDGTIPSVEKHSWLQLNNYRQNIQTDADFNPVDVSCSTNDSYTAKGILKDKTGQPLAGVTVEVAGKTTVTDAQGNWSIGGLPEGKYDMIASLDNYRCVNDGFEMGNQQYQQNVSCSALTQMKVMVKSDSWQSINIGQTVTFTITTINGGAEVATGVTLQNKVTGYQFQGNDNAVEIVSLDGSSGVVCDAQTLLCQLPDMQSGERVEMKLTVRAIQSGDVKNVATLSSNEYPADKRGTSAVGIKPDLFVSTSDDPKRVEPLGTIHYVIKPELSPFVSEAAQNVQLQMDLTEGTVLQSLSTSQGDCDTSAYPKVVCALGDMATGAVADLAVDIKLTDPNLLTVLNKVTISADNYAKAIKRERTQVVLPPVKVDVIFLIDTTNSMQEEKAAVIQGLTDYIDEAVALGKAPMIALVEFKDKVSLVHASNDMQALKQQIQGLKVEGGGLCPEASAEALDLALDHIKDGGTIILTTDASPYENSDIEGLINRINEKQVRFIPFISGDCTSGQDSWNNLESGVHQ